MWVGPQCLTLAAFPLRKSPKTHCTGGWVGPKASLNGHAKSYHQQDLIPDCLAHTMLLY